MTLREFLHKKRIRASTFAKSIGYEQSTVSMWMSGDRFPEPNAVIEIEEETKGWVKSADWYAELKDQAEEPASDGA